MIFVDSGQIAEWKQFRNDLLGNDAVTELVSGNHMTLCRYTINNKVKVAAHSHEYEQISLVLHGEMLLTVGDKIISMKAGDVQVIPSNVKHSSEIIETPFQTIESFSPVRVDFLKKMRNSSDQSGPN
jgi:quercetin dioxygenase-like cupin family protein